MFVAAVVVVAVVAGVGAGVVEGVGAVAGRGRVPAGVVVARAAAA